MAQRSASKPRARPTPNVGTDEVDLAICALIEGRPLITNADLGRELPMDVGAVAKRRNRPAFKALYTERNPPATKILAAYRDSAAKIYVNLMTDKKTPVALVEKVARVISGADQKPVKVNVSGAIKGDVRLGLDEETKRRIRERYGVDAPAGGGRKRARGKGRGHGTPRRAGRPVAD